MWPDRVSNPGPLTYKSGALPTALRSPDPQLLIQYLIQGFETLHSSAYIWHVQKRNQTLIQVIIAELFPLKRHTCSPFVIALASSFINLFRHSYIGYDNNLNKITFMLVGSMSRAQLLFIEKHCHHSIAFIYRPILI